MVLPILVTLAGAAVLLAVRYDRAPIGLRGGGALLLTLGTISLAASLFSW